MLAKRKAESEMNGGGASKQPRQAAVRRALTSSDTKNKNSRVKVYVRVRPLKSSENPNNKIIEVMSEEPRTSLIFDPKVEEEKFYFKNELQTMRDINKKVKKNQLFEFDQVFCPMDDNQMVFNSTAKTIIPSILEGYNCSVFAYGATGAGKTYTMLGKEDSPGISYLTIKELLQQIDAQQDRLKIKICVSYLEVYNEEVRDLLSPSTKKLDLRDEAGGAVHVTGLKVVTITDTEQLFSLLESGNKQRSQHPTDSNAESSRSHAVFQVGVSMSERGSSQVRLAKLTMIDLAGSERGCATGFQGKQFKEGRAINQSLLALGNCINALADGQKYVPYRDSKLTRILKDSLGGNCRTIMIANISPSNVSYDETYNTLKYATRARSITTTANQNFIKCNMSVTQYRQTVIELKNKLSKSESELSELMTWKKDIDLVMGERLKVYTEVMALESQKKITEWRLNEATSTQNLLESNDYCERLQSSMDQWRKRIEVLNARIQELEPKVRQSKIDGRKVEDRMQKCLQCIGPDSFVAELFHNVQLSWKSRLNDALREVELQHYLTINKLEKKNNELLTNFKQELVPLYKTSFNLLKAYGHVTGSMTEQHELAMKRLQRIKYVSWEHIERAEEVSNGLFDGRLMWPGEDVKESGETRIPAGDRNVVPAGGGLARIRHTTPHKNDKRFVSPLRSIKSSSRTITRVNSKSPNPKLLSHLISSLNKENVVKNSATKKNIYSANNIKDLIKKTPLRSITSNVKAV